MRKEYIKDIRYAFKTPEYWFCIILLLISSAWTAVYHLDRYGVMYETKIGAAEFFYASTMLGNTLLQISVPVIPIFCSMYASGIMQKPKNSESHTKSLMIQILSVLTISASVFLLSYIIIAVSGLIIFGTSTGDIDLLIAPYSNIYYKAPYLIIVISILHSCVFAGIYSIMGMGIGMNLKRNKEFALIIPLAFYFCFQYAKQLLPDSIADIVYWIFPMETFAIASYDVPIIKNIIEMVFILVVGVTLIFVSKRKKNKFV